MNELLPCFCTLRTHPPHVSQTQTWTSSKFRAEECWQYKKSFSHLDALPSSYRASLARLCRRWHWWIETIFSVISSCGKREKGWKNLWKEKSSRQPESRALQWREFCFLALMEYRRILCGFRSLKILHATILEGLYVWSATVKSLRPDSGNRNKLILLRVNLELILQI